MEMMPQEPQRATDAHTTRRALLLFGLGGLGIAGMLIALPFTTVSQLTRTPSTGLSSVNSAASNTTFAKATAGDCLMWPENIPDAITIVNCDDEHRFEVAESVDMRTFPGTEYSPDAPAPSATRIQQISLEQCQPAVQSYLADKYDPNSKFVISMLWPGEKAWNHSGQRRMLCGLHLPTHLAEPQNRYDISTGNVVDTDQSKIWPAGTCLGINPTTNQPTDIPVDCTAPHATEVTGSVNLAEYFPGELPAETDQDQIIKDRCSRITDSYLDPVKLRNTTLTLIYSTITLPSWTAGSHHVTCSIGATDDEQGWATLVNSATAELLINGRPPIAPPDIPEERLKMSQDFQTETPTTPGSDGP